MSTVAVTNTDAGLSATKLLNAEGADTVTGLKTFDRDPNPPFAVSSGSAVVPNLDADKLDGNEAAAFLLKTGGTLTGALLFSTDNTVDIGASGATRPRDVFIGRDVAVGRNVAVVGTVQQGAGGGSETFLGSGIINFDSTAQATPADTSDHALFTYSLPASTLNVTGRTIRVTAWGNFAGNGNNKTIRLKWNGLAGTTVCTHTSAANGSQWVIRGLIIRNGLNAQDLVGELPIDAGGVTTGPHNATATATETGAIDIVVSGQNGSASADIQYEGSIIECLN